MRKLIFISLFLVLLTGLAGAVSNTYTQSGTWDLKSSLPTTNTYDSSKITSMNITATPMYTHVDPDNISGLVARWKMNDVSGTNVTNSVNTSNNGTLQGHIAWNTTGGKYNGCSVFNANGQNDGIMSIKDPVLGQTAFTYSSWVYGNNYTLYMTPFMDYNGSAKNIIISSYAINTMRFYVGDGTNLSPSITNNYWTNNTWHMVTATFNGTTGNMAIWVDLNKASQSTTITHIGNVQASGYSCAIGYNNQQFSSTQGFLNGSIDDMCFWNRSLTDNEIQSLYYSQLSGVGIKTNANTNSGIIPDNGGNVAIPYSAGSVTSLSAVIPNNITVGSTTIYDYANTVSPITYAFTSTSSQEYSPVASFTKTASGIRPITISFTDTSTNYPTTWAWDFGDGSANSTIQNPTHTYTTAGAYKIIMTAYNGQGSSSTNSYITVDPQNGDNGVINNNKRIAIYIENTDVNPMSHDTGFGSMLHEYNITYLTNATLPSSLSPSNYDLLVVGNASDNTDYGVCTNSSAYYINNYIASGGCVWFISDPLNETNYYTTDMSNITWQLPTNRFYCLGTLHQVNVLAGQTLSVNNTDAATSFLTSPQTILSTLNRWTNGRNFGSVDGTNAYGYRYTELVYNGNDCYLAKIWNTTTGSRVIYSNVQSLVSGGSISYFNATTSAKLFNNIKQWVLRLDTNTQQVSVTYPKGDKQFVACFDDIDLAAPVHNMNNFYDMIHSQPNNIGITGFVIPDGRQNGTTPGIMTSGYQYMLSNGTDLNTIHPHQNNLNNPSPTSVDWYNNTATLADMQIALNLYMQNYSAGINNNPSLTFYSIRFPQTKVNTTSSQAAVNLGFKIASDYGQATTMGSFVDSYVNMRYMQHQKILSGVKTSQIEIVAPTSYDTSYATDGDMQASGASGWTTALENSIPPYLASGFPSVYLLDGHYQWSMTNTSFTNSVRDTLWYTDNQSSYTAYTNLATLAQYEIAMQDAHIRVDTSGTTTTAVVTAVEPIKNFTLKLQNITTGVKVYLDGNIFGNGQLDSSHVIYEDGVYYVFCDIPTGTHTLVIKDENVANGARYIGKNGAVSVPIDSGNTIKNNGATSHTISTTSLYTNGINVAGATNTLYVGAHNSSTAVDGVVHPSSGTVNVTILNWTNKSWKESSTTQPHTEHIFSGFDANTPIKITRDGVDYTVVKSNDTGYIDWTYTGGYSEHTFTASPTGAVSMTVVSDKGMLTNVSTTASYLDISANTVITGLYANIKSIITSGYALATLMVLALAAGAILRYLGYL